MVGDIDTDICRSTDSSVGLSAISLRRRSERVILATSTKNRSFGVMAHFSCGAETLWH
jgi:hypothetical protein